MVEFLDSQTVRESLSGQSGSSSHTRGAATDFLCLQDQPCGSVRAQQP